EVRRASFWTLDLGPADVVTCYLFPDVMARLAEKLAAELRPGARVVSFNFPLPGWRPERVLAPDSSRHGDPIYIYRWPRALTGAD
ncbi:MAG: SAM-dependent methyltransferase, partial [Proteobacteria bacterium]|nr:SAM-dependent methyltransferase [Pseudomonadota bacterium]